MRKIYYSADFHLCHDNIIKHTNRPFQDVDEMNTTLISNWNSVVKSTDEVYYLGDCYVKNPQYAGKLFQQLNGKIYLIKGNHDKTRDINKYFNNRFEWIKDYAEMEYVFENTHYHLVMMHFPIWSWNRRFHKAFHLHGHCHFKDPLFNEFDKNGLSMDVGVDGNNFTPISIEDVITKINTKKVF
jgi:calcineurin-like phosphoesterase family protein